MECPKCGAPLTRNGVCEYCGYDNGFHGNISNLEGTITIDGEEVQVYLAQTEIEVEDETFRDFDGTLHRVISQVKRKFTLIER